MNRRISKTSSQPAKELRPRNGHKHLRDVCRRINYPLRRLLRAIYNIRISLHLVPGESCRINLYSRRWARLGRGKIVTFRRCSPVFCRPILPGRGQLPPAYVPRCLPTPEPYSSSSFRKSPRELSRWNSVKRASCIRVNLAKLPLFRARAEIKGYSTVIEKRLTKILNE